MQNNNKDISCQNCNSKNIIKKGIRKNKQQVLQQYYCKEGNKFFTLTPQQTKHKSYSAKIILNALSYYNLGNTQTETSTLISQRFKCL